MLEDKLQFLTERGLLRKKHLQWIFKSDLISLGEEIQYRLELTMEVTIKYVQPNLWKYLNQFRGLAWVLYQR